MFVTDISTVY